MKIFDKQIMEEANQKLLGKRSNCSNLIFVYTPIKVGSTTLVTSIRISTNNHFTVLHLHDEDCLRVLTGIKDVTINDLILYNSLIGKNVYVIDVYRSPIERKISSFFELIELHFTNSQENINVYPIEKVINRFNNLFLHIANEDYFMDKYQIDVPHNFDFNKKFVFIKENNIHYIKLRLKDSNEWGSILSCLLQNEIIIVTDYETSGKKIKDLYNNFKNNYKIPYNLLEEIKKDKYLNYYYSQEEKNMYLSDWENRVKESIIVYNKSEYELYFKIIIENNTKNLIQKNHYIDLGCTCMVCNNKRNNILERVKKGEKIIEKIEHNELVEKYIINKKKIIIDNINNINTAKRNNLNKMINVNHGIKMKIK